MEHSKLIKYARALTLVVFTVLFAACSGGGGSDDSAASSGTGSDSTPPPPTTSPSFINWQGNSNGAVVLAANNVQLRFLTNGDLYYDNKEYSNVNLASTSSATVNLNGKPFATVSSAAGTNNAVIAVLYCLGTTTLAQIVPTGTTISIVCNTSGSSSTGGTVSSGSSGGSTGANATFGAIAASGNRTHLLGEGITHDYPAQAQADSAAVSYCNSTGVAGCGVITVFGTNQCGALAVGQNLAWGSANDSSLTGAEANAINECVSVGGQGCQISLSACN